MNIKTYFIKRTEPLRPKRCFSTRSSLHLANTIGTATGGSDASSPTAVTTPASIGSKSIPTAASVEVQQQQQLAHLPATPLAKLDALQNKNMSVNSLPNVIEGIALGNGGRIGDGINRPSNNGAGSGGAAYSTGLSTVSSPKTMIAPITVVDHQPLKMNGTTTSSQNLASAIDPKALIIENEPTTEWTPEIPFKNVTSRLDFIWKQQSERELINMKSNRALNDKLIKNILPNPVSFL